MIAAHFHGLPAAILFDLDGTLIDSAPDLAAAVDATLDQLSLPVAGAVLARRWVGNGARMLMARALAHAQQDDVENLSATTIDTALAIFFSHYERYCTRDSTLYPDVLAALQYWREAAVPMAVVTNKPGRFTAPMLDHYGLRAFFPVVISGDTLAVKKPDPAPLFEACRQLGVAVSGTLMVGDSINDVQAARNAGMPVACVDYGYNHGEPIANAGPDWLVSSFRQLVD